MSTVGSADISIKWDNAAIADIEKRTAQGLIAMGYDVARNARNRAPVLTGALKSSIRIETSRMSSYTVYVRAGGIGGVRYARRREFENKLHPLTRHYMSNGLKDTTSGNWERFFKGRIK